jgi:hypothetical protein
VARPEDLAERDLARAAAPRAQHPSAWRPAFARSLVPKLTALAKDLDHYLGYYNFDRAHTGRLTKGPIPGEIVYGARKMKATR